MKISEVKQIRANAPSKVVVLKFTATWCKPCQRIAPLIKESLSKKPANYLFYEVDIDKSTDVYIAFKSKKMIKGVPSMLAFYGDSDEDEWYIPDELVCGSDVAAVRTFFADTFEKAREMSKS